MGRWLRCWCNSSLIPNRVLQLLTLLTIMVLLGLSRCSYTDFFVDDTFTEAFSYLTLRTGPHEWYGVLGIASRGLGSDCSAYSALVPLLMTCTRPPYFRKSSFAHFFQG